LLGAGYMPQEQALGLFGAAVTPASLAARGQQTGAQYGAELGLGGIEARLQAEDLANQLRLQQQSALLGGLFGREATLQEQVAAAALGQPNLASGDTGLLSQGLNWLSGRLGGGLSTNQNYTPTNTVQDVQDVLDLSNYNVLDDANYS